MPPEIKIGEKATWSLPVTIKSVDEENHTLEAVFSSQKEDRHGDTVMQDGWDLKQFKKNPVILNSHNYNDASEVIGKAIPSSLKIEKKQLVGKIKFAVEENPKAKLIFDLFVGGYLNAFSVGFIPKSFKEDDYYTIEEAELLEVSAVSVPANAYALAKSKGLQMDDEDGNPIVPVAEEKEPEETTEPKEPAQDDADEPVVPEPTKDTETPEEKRMRLKGELAELDAAHPEPVPEVVPTPVTTPNYKTQVAMALKNIDTKQAYALVRANTIIKSLLNDSGKKNNLPADTKAKIHTRKVNQAIRTLIAAK